MNDYEPSLILNITNLLPDPIVVLDRMGTIQWCNAATFKVTQLAKEDLIGKRFTKLSVLKAVDIPRYIKIFASILKGDSVKHYSATWERKDGTIFETDAQVEPITTPEGKKAILVITRDTTEQKEIHKAYRLARFSIENAADPIFWFDDEANIHYVNTAACKTLSYSNNELSKMTIHDIDPEFSSERWPSFIRELKQNRSLTFESTHISKDRKLCPVEVSVQRLEFEGQVLNFAYVKNIAERKMAEETILRSEEQNRFIVNSMSDLILIYDDDDFLRECYTSDESLLYLPWEQMKDKKPEECMPNTIVETHYELAKIVKETGDHIVYEYELEIRREHRWFQGTMMLHQDKKNLVVAIKEITERKLTQIALEKSEKRFRDLFLNAPVGLFRTNKAGKIVECNLMGAKLLGCNSPKEVIEDYNPIDHYVDPKRRLELLKELSEFGEVSNFQAEITKIDGRPIWIEFYSKLYREEEFLDTVIIDIIQRKEAEEKLKQSEERYRSLVEHMPDVVWTADTKGRTLYISPNILDVYGFTSEEIYEAGERLWFGRIHPDDKEHVKQEFEDLFRTGKGMAVEYRIQKKDGEWIWLHDRSFGTYERNGEILASGVFSDITHAKQMEVALKESEQRCRSIFEQAAVGMARVDKEGFIVEANSRLEEILGYGGNGLVGVNVFEITTEEDANLEHQLSEELLSGKRNHYSMEKCFIHKDGKQIMGRLTVSLSRNSTDEIDFSIGVLEDITEYKRVQEALAISEDRFRSIVKSAGVGITIVDIEDHILEANEKFLELIGHSLDELRQMKISEFTHPEDAEKDAVFFGEIQDGKRNSYQMEKRYIRKDGVTIWGNLTVSVVRNQVGDIDIIVGIVEDITDRKNTEDALLTSAQRYRELIENLPGSVGISDLNEQLVMVNPAFCELFGYGEDELIGLKVLDIINPKEYDRMLSETEKRRKGDASIYEVQIIRKDGSFRDTKVSAVPQRNDEGHIIGTIALLTDISEIKRVQDSLSASEKRLRNLIEQLPLGVAIANFTEHIELVNQAMADMLCQEKEKLIDSNLIDYLEPSYLTKMRNETECRKTGAKSTYDVEMVRTDGVKCNVRVSAGPNYNSQGQVIGSVGVFEDITENKRNEAIRAQQESEIDLYGSLLRHDLRNDLGLILSYVEAVQMLMQSTDEEVRSFLDSAIASIERMANLLNGFGRPQDIRQVDIVEFIREIADEAQESAKGLHINVFYEEDTSDVKIAAGGLLALVFMNLFRNSVQHAGEKPLIEIRVSKQENQLAITVADNGPGVPEEFHSRLFSRGTSSKGEAGGLGLYLSKQIMERTGGTIALLKDTKGAVFLLTLPT
ncbi:MAG: PAS domain S-box protein [Candidatus Thorarchaeota archaeon]|nr:MAG: PAS domain S-box protein [Candidatus Thorarchaeota archaeon]